MIRSIQRDLWGTLIAIQNLTSLNIVPPSAFSTPLYVTVEAIMASMRCLYGLQRDATLLAEKREDQVGFLEF